MLIVCLLLFFLFPIIGLPVFLFFYLFDSKKKGIIYSLLIGVTLGIIIYYFIPPSNYDLFRHQLILKQVENLNFAQFLIKAKTIDLEIIPLIYSYIISLTSNYNLLQFFVVSLGYTLMFYMMYDYRKKVNISNPAFIIVVVFNIFGFNALYFISGLYYYIAIILFAFAFYNEYTKGGNKLLSYIIYFLTLFIHNSMFFIVAILFIFKLFKNKLSFKSIATCLLIFIFSYYVINFINNIFSSEIFATILNMYNVYIKENYRMHKLYRGMIFFIEITKLIVIILSIVLNKNRKKSVKENSFIILLAISTILMMPKSIVMIRFIMGIQLIGIVPLMNYFSKGKINLVKLSLYIITFILGVLYITYFYKVFRNENFEGLSLFKNIFSLIKGG